MMKVAIVGSGPAGCIAAWACHMHGIVPQVYTDATAPSTVRGAQYLHKPFVLPGGAEAHIAPKKITYIKIGTKEDYARKIYGPDFDPALTSWDSFPGGDVSAWPLRAVYELLYDQARPYMRELVVTRETMHLLLGRYDLVFNTAPGHLYAEDPQAFTSETVQISSRPCVDFDPKHGNYIVYEGTLSIPHYRYSLIEGHESWEYPANAEPWRGDTTFPVVKPLKLNSPMMSDKIVPLGRYGEWKKGVLLDHVWDKATATLEEKGLQWLG